MFQSDGTYTAAPSSRKLHVSSSQPRFGSRCLFIHSVQWALTFPNLRRHYEKICLTALPLRGSLRYLPLRSFARSFYELCCVFRLLTVNLRQSCRPTTGRGSTCTCAPLGCLFHSGICKLARQPYVLDCFALIFCSSNACLSLSDPPTLTLMIPL